MASNPNNKHNRPPKRRRLPAKVTTRYIVAVVLIATVIAAAYAIVSIPDTSRRETQSESVRAIDSASTITDKEWFKKAYDDGFRLYVLHTTSWGTCDKWYMTEPQIKMALDAGLKVAAYTRDPQCWREGVLAAGPYVDDLQFFALDVETKPGIAVTREMVDGIKNMGVRPVIYTGSGMWNDVQANGDKDFSDVALWDTNVQSFDFATWTADYKQPTPVEYGGWNTPTTMRVGIQQQFEYTLNGIKVDLNSFQSDFLE